MKLTVLGSTSDTSEALASLSAWATTIDFAYAWVSTNAGNAAHWKGLDHAKIKRALIGTQFAQTEPWVLKELDTVPDRLRLIISAEGTFHPKLAIARNDDQVRVLIGSSNLTTAGFSTNTELNILVESSSSEQEARRFISFFEEVWESGTKLDYTWLVAYEESWRRRPKGAGAVPHVALAPKSFDSVNLDWEQFVALILSQEGRPINKTFKISLFNDRASYLAEFRTGRRVFGETEAFADIPLEDRKRVIGMGDSSGLLGTMNAAGYAKQVVFSSPEKIGQYLDSIPLDGLVDPTLARKTVEGLTTIRGVSLGVASRLLVAKRPDMFVSVNNGSREGLRGIQAGRKITTAKHYCDLLQSLWSTPWFLSDPPVGPSERIIWDNRMGFLDAALYVEV